MIKNINIAFTSDKNYFSQLAVAIMSIKDNMTERNVHIYVLTDEENRDTSNVKNINKLCQTNLEITFLYISAEMFQRYEFSKPGSHLTIATVYRLFLSELLPTEVEKIIFLDTDMLICSDLHELYDEDIEDALMGVVVEGADEDRIFIQNTLSYLFDYYENEEELYRSYFNAGMLLINMVEFRKQNIGHQCMQLLTEHPEFVYYDQDALNIVCKGKVKYLNPKWNRIWRRELADGSTGTGCLANNMDDIKIIHYCTGFKPWADPEYKLADKFLNTVYDTEWYPGLIDDMRSITLQRVFMYKFPWQQVKAGNEIMIYGAGQVGDCQVHQMQLTGYCCVKAVIDKNADKLKIIRDIPVISIENLKELYKGEKIIIAILKKKIRLEIKALLIRCDIPEKNIIWDYEVE